MSKPTVYLETSVIGYLTSRQSRDIIVAAQQQLTQEWWENRRIDFDLYVSPLVLQEAGSGNAEEAVRRLEAVNGLPLLDNAGDVPALANALVKHGPLPTKATADAVHMATAAVYQMDYLLTWNCKHIANAAMRSQVEAICLAAGYRIPILCTPQELMEKVKGEEDVE